jgi:hypothetical protein
MVCIMLRKQRPLDFAMLTALFLVFFDAKKTEASEFCYVNGIVLGILELLKVHTVIFFSLFPSILC